MAAKKRANTVKFNDQVQEGKTMVSCDTSIPINTKGKNHPKNPKNDKDAEVPSQDGRTCGIYRINLGEPVNDLEDDSKPETESEHTYDSGI